MDLLIIDIPLRDGTKYQIEQEDLEIWRNLYEFVDVDLELKKLLGWNLANPAKRKTKRGIKKHINSWLSRANDKGVQYGPIRARTKQTILQRHTDRSWAPGV